MSLEGLINAVALVLMAYLLGGGAQPKPPTIPSCWVSPVQLECWTFAATPAWPGRARTARLGVSKRHGGAGRRPCNTSDKHPAIWTLMDIVR
ncbi:Uncharacterised protein [Acinetobacter baumannii]|nr:hypothetical protein IPC1578_05200 [Pseudomonas aeruginosa]POO67010.1 hypothetical protein C3F46_08485 [Pseudomonas aeruginosa]SVK35599.1 Uncharacterised protein [Acinetobacter baumannii]